MTYYEIILWIQNYLIELNEVQLGKYEITHLDDDGRVFTMKANSLIEAVLKINQLDLIG